MEKELCTITEKLKDVPEGSCINIRHPLGRADIITTASSESVPDSVRLKSETFELYPGIELSFPLAISQIIFEFTTIMASPFFPSITAVAGRIGWEMKGGLSLYFGNGDLSFHYTDKCSDSDITHSARIL